MRGKHSEFSWSASLFRSLSYCGRSEERFFGAISNLKDRCADAGAMAGFSGRAQHIFHRTRALAARVFVTRRWPIRRLVCRSATELVEDVVGFAGEGGEAVAQGLQNGQAVMLVLAKVGTDEQGCRYLGDDLVVIRERDATTNLYTIRYQHNDGLGSALVETDANRNVLTRTEYEPYWPVQPSDAGRAGLHRACAGCGHRADLHAAAVLRPGYWAVPVS